MPPDMTKCLSQINGMASSYARTCYSAIIIWESVPLWPPRRVASPTYGCPANYKRSFTHPVGGSFSPILRLASKTFFLAPNTLLTVFLTWSSEGPRWFTSNVRLSCRRAETPLREAMLSAGHRLWPHPLPPADSDHILYHMLALTTSPIDVRQSQNIGVLNLHIKAVGWDICRMRGSNF